MHDDVKTNKKWFQNFSLKNFSTVDLFSSIEIGIYQYNSTTCLHKINQTNDILLFGLE